MEPKKSRMSASKAKCAPSMKPTLILSSASVADRFGRNPKLAGPKSASKIGTRTILAAWLGHPVAHGGDAQRPLGAFVFPSPYEGLGGSLIEAMALGLPVLASDIPTFREILDPGGNALLFEPGNPVELARALEKILDDPELARAFGRRSREIFEERFLLEESAARSVELYRDVLAGAGPRPAGVPAGGPGTGAPAA